MVAARMVSVLDNVPRSVEAAVQFPQRRERAAEDFWVSVELVVDLNDLGIDASQKDVEVKERAQRSPLAGGS